MKIFLLLTAAMLLPSAPFQILREKGGYLRQSELTITNVSSAMAYEPGRMTIRGQGFDLVTEVRIGGQAVPILHLTRNEIVVQPRNMDPGFFPLEVIRPDKVARDRAEFTPNLVASRTGNVIQMLLNPGEAGTVWFHWSLRRLATPGIVPSVYYMQLLDLTVPCSGLLCSAVSTAGEPLLATLNVPPLTRGGLFRFFHYPYASGGVYLQAFCMLGHDADMCFTNMVSLPIPVPDPTQ